MYVTNSTNRERLDITGGDTSGDIDDEILGRAKRLIIKSITVFGSYNFVGTLGRIRFRQAPEHRRRHTVVVVVRIAR